MKERVENNREPGLNREEGVENYIKKRNKIMRGSRITSTSELV